MIARARATLAVLVLLLLQSVPLGAQQPSVPLERFMVQVARLWEAGDADAIAALAPSSERLALDVGSGSRGAVQTRHAAATLRALFNERETVSARPTRVTIAGSRPVQGFGELSWATRARGMPVQGAATVYVGAVWESDGWKIREIRILR